MQGYDDPQTEADRRAERCIVATLTTRFPNITVIGEEVRNLVTVLCGLHAVHLQLCNLIPIPWTGYSPSHLQMQTFRQ